jgi:putative endonuclease
MTASDVWYTYMVRCRDRSLYTGIAKDIDRRLAEHNSTNNGARYTRTRRPVRLVFLERFSSRSAAAKREHELKRLPRAEKQKLAQDRAASPAMNRGADTSRSRLK